MQTLEEENSPLPPGTQDSSHPLDTPESLHCLLLAQTQMVHASNPDATPAGSPSPSHDDGPPKPIPKRSCGRSVNLKDSSQHPVTADNHDDVPDSQTTPALRIDPTEDLPSLSHNNPNFDVPVDTLFDDNWPKPIGEEESEEVGTTGVDIEEDSEEFGTRHFFDLDEEGSSSRSDFITTQKRRQRYKRKQKLPTTSDEDAEDEETFKAEYEAGARHTKSVASESDKDSADQDSYAKKSGPLSAKVKSQATELHDAYVTNMKQLARDSGVSVNALHRHVGDVTVKHRGVSTWNAFQAYQAAHSNERPNNCKSQLS